MSLELYDKIISCIFSKELYAHTSVKGLEGLRAHSKLTLHTYRNIQKDTVERISKELDLVESIVSYLIESAIFMHDVGKATPYFQYNKMGQGETPCNNCDDLSHHAQLSAVYYLDQMIQFISQSVEDKKNDYILMTILLTECIAKHHSKLTNIHTFVEAFDDYLLQLKNNKDTTDLFLYFEYIPRFIGVPHYVHDVLEHVMEETTDDFREKLYGCGLLFFSLLSVSDILATKSFVQEFHYEEDSYTNLLKQKIQEEYNASELNQKIQNYKEAPVSLDRRINEIRSEFILDMDDRIRQIEPGQRLFHLEGMVGIGKTHASQRFVVHLLQEEQAECIYWGVPYLSIAGQWDTVNKGLDSQSVRLDSKTPIRYEYDNEGQEDYSRMVVNDQLMNYRQGTFTFVRFFNLLFSNSKRDALKRLSLRNSIIVLDEIQSIDILLMNQLLQQIERMTELLNMRVVFMSATLPRFEKTFGISQPEKYRKETLLAGRNYLNMAYYDKDVTYQQILEEIKIENKRILIQTVTKKRSMALYDELCEIYQNVYLYTGDTGISDRKKIIDMLQEKDFQGNYCHKEVILVTTNAIEAGVDISMNMAIVNLTSLDSLEQLSGRINRNNEFDRNESALYLVNFEKADFMFPIKSHYTKALGLSKLSEMFETKNYKPFMTEVLLLAKRSQKNQLQIETIQKLKFREMSRLMRLITTDSCFYYHIRDEESRKLMKLYQQCSEEMTNNKSHYDEYYIRRREAMIALDDYKHVIGDKRYISLFVKEYPDESIVFYENIGTFEENNKLREDI